MNFTLSYVPDGARINGDPNLSYDTETTVPLWKDLTAQKIAILVVVKNYLMDF